MLSAADAAAQARVTGKPVEATALTTETERTYANPDGTVRLDLNMQPVRVKRNGAWVGLDSNLVANGDGTFSPKATASRLVVSGGGDGPLATMTSTRGEQLALSWPGALPSPTIAGDTATYSNVLPNVDLKLIANVSGGFSHVLVVKNATAAANPALTSLRMPLALKGITISADAAGNIVAANEVGNPVFTAPAPTMWDSTSSSDPATSASTGTFAASTAEEPGEAAAIGDVGVQVDATALTLAPSVSALSSPTARFPLFIDPSWVPTKLGKNAWTFVSSGNPTTSYYNSSDRARAGKTIWATPNYVARTFWKFAIPTAIWGKNINSAILQTKEVWSAQNTARDITLNHISTSSSAISASTTWDTQPTKGAAIVTKNVVADWRDDDSELAVQVDFTITNEIKSAARDHWSFDTIGMYNDTETDPYAWRKFENNPTLAINYNSAPNTPANLATQPTVPCSGGTIGNTQVFLNAKVTDPDGTNNALTTTFTLTDTSVTPNVSTDLVTGGSSGMTVNVNEPAAWFQDGHTYTWTAKTTDGIDTSLSATPCTFTIDKSAPGSPGITSTEFPKGQLGQPAGSSGTFTITPGAGNTPAKYIWGLNVAPPVTSAGPASPQSNWNVLTSTGTSTSLTVPVKHVGPNVLYVYAVDANGNASGYTSYDFTTDRKPTPDRYSDFNGDGNPDLLRVGDAANPGLWLYTGTDELGHLATSGIQLGGLGTGFAGSTGTVADWTGATVTPGDYNADGAQDIFVRLPNTNLEGSNVEILLGSGDGMPFQPNDTDVKVPVNLPTIDGAQHSQAVDSVVATPPDNQFDPALWQEQGLQTPLPDLYVTIGDTLYLYVPSYPGIIYDLLDATKTVNQYQELAAAPGSVPRLFVRDRVVGSLIRLEGTLFDSDTGTPGVWLGSGAASTLIGKTGWSAVTIASVSGADIDDDGIPDIWSRQLPATPLTIFGRLSTASSGLNVTVSNPDLTQAASLVGEWDLGERTGTIGNDATFYNHPLALSTGASFASTGHKADDIGSMNLTGVTTQQATTVSPVVRTDQSFSVSLWVYLTDSSTTSVRTVLAEKDSTLAAFFIQKRFDTWAFGRASSPTTGGVVVAQTTAAPARNTWVHLVATYDSTTGDMALYVNGSVAATQAACGCNWNATGGVLVGRTQWTQTSGEQWTGNVDNIQLYQGLLTPAQIAALHTQ
ncbi:LamG-like jellyroll fold domain-containing protein [Hamadaea sp. NPDC051192]|uniref:LamG-like jellyroll fold domain-containing protein n=1 Tax=Hamadaea sp. NPDC051192 TaxID=3154940 RepID=UPI003444833A